jgi:hypothetical protein
MSPIEKNARRLVGVLAEFFPAGSNCEDLRLKFQQIANRKHSTFYACLHFARAKRWIVADDEEKNYRTYTLNSDGSWRTPSIGEGLERHQFEHVLETRAERIEQLEKRNRQLHASRKAIAAGEAAGPAIGALVEIMSDSKVSVRGRLQAAENLLAFKSPPDVAESAKRFLASIFTDPEQAIDHRLAATTALRRAEDTRIMPPIERPLARPDDSAKAEKPYEPLAVVVARQRARLDRLLALPLEERERMIPGVVRRDGGNGQDD